MDYSETSCHGSRKLSIWQILRIKDLFLYHLYQLPVYCLSAPNILHHLLCEKFIGAFSFLLPLAWCYTLSVEGAGHRAHAGFLVPVCTLTGLGCSGGTPRPSSCCWGCFLSSGFCGMHRFFSVQFPPWISFSSSQLLQCRQLPEHWASVLHSGHWHLWGLTAECLQGDTFLQLSPAPEGILPTSSRAWISRKFCQHSSRATCLPFSESQPCALQQGLGLSQEVRGVIYLRPTQSKG